MFGTHILVYMYVYPYKISTYLIRDNFYISLEVETMGAWVKLCPCGIKPLEA